MCNLANIYTLERSVLFNSSLDRILALESTALFLETGPNRQNAVHRGDFWRVARYQEWFKAWQSLILIHCDEL